MSRVLLDAAAIPLLSGRTLGSAKRLHLDARHGRADRGAQRRAGPGADAIVTDRVGVQTAEHGIRRVPCMQTRAFRAEEGFRSPPQVLIVYCRRSIGPSLADDTW